MLKFVRDVRDVDSGSDHFLLITKMWLRFKRLKQAEKQMIFDTAKLKDINIKNFKEWMERIMDINWWSAFADLVIFTEEVLWKTSLFVQCQNCVEKRKLFLAQILYGQIWQNWSTDKKTCFQADDIKIKKMKKHKTSAKTFWPCIFLLLTYINWL